MNLQFIQDSQGNTTGIYIPIEEWQLLKQKYGELEKEERDNLTELASWQTDILDARIEDYEKNPTNLLDFDKTIDDIEKGL